MNVYKLTFPNGKKYIGITTKSVLTRFKQHCRKTEKSIVSSAIKKYGRENVKISTVFKCNDFDLLKLAEVEFIEKLNTLVPNGYNVSEGGDGCLGYKHNEERRKKISDSLKGRVFSEDTKKKMSISARNGVTNEKRDRLSKLKTGTKLSKETKQKISKSLIGNTSALGVKHTDESKSNMSKSKIGNTFRLGKSHSDSVKKQMSKSHSGKKHTEETKEKMRMSALRRWESRSIDK